MKKFYSIIFMICIFSFFLQGLTIYTGAINKEFIKEKMDITDQEKILSKIQIDRIEEAPEKVGLLCFDVSDTECIAVGSERLAQKYILVYDKKGLFLYGYKINIDGKFGVGWTEKNLVIYLVRENAVITIGDSDKILSCEKIVDSSDNASYWNNEIFSTQRVKKGNYYTMKNQTSILTKFTMSSYSILERKDISGNTNFIYNNSSNFAVKQILEMIFVFSFIVIIIITIFKHLKRSNLN